MQECQASGQGVQTLRFRWSLSPRSADWNAGVAMEFPLRSGSEAERSTQAQGQWPPARTSYHRPHKAAALSAERPKCAHCGHCSHVISFGYRSNVGEGSLPTLVFDDGNRSPRRSAANRISGDNDGGPDHQDWINQAAEGLRNAQTVTQIL